MRYLIFVLIGVLLLGFRIYIFFGQLPSYSDGQLVEFVGSISSVPYSGARVQRFTFSTDQGQKFYITTLIDTEYYYGMRIRVSGKVKEVVLGGEKPASSAQTLDSTRGRKILTLAFPLVAPSPRKGMVGNFVDTFYGRSSQFRSGIMEFYGRNLSRNGAAFLSGVVLGVDSGLEKSYKNDLSRLGVIHVVAASGMNVAIIASVFFSLFSRFFHRKMAVIVSLVAIAFYTVLAGGQASIVRAAIMGSIAFAATLIGRQHFGILALFITAFGMLLLSPIYIEDVGFQLSVLSTLGLLLLPNFFERLGALRIASLKSFAFIKDDFLLTFSAQVMTLPVLFYHFGEYSLVSLPVNLLILWVIPPLMILGGLGAVVSFVSGEIGYLFLLLCIPFLYYFEFIINVFSQQSVGIRGEMHFVFVIAYYLLLLGVYIFFRKKKEKE